MKYDDLEKTQDLFDINEEIPLPIDNIEMEGINKEVVTDEFTLNLTEKKESTKKASENKEPKKKSKEKKDKKSLKDKWHDLTKKQKILTIAIISLVLIIITTVILLIVLKKEDKPIEVPKEPEKPVVIIEKDNYIYKDGNLVLIDSDDNELGTYECVNKDENLCFVAFFNDEDTFNTSKNVYEDKSLLKRRIPIIANKYVFINDSENTENSNIILYNILEQKEENKYTLVKGFSDSNIVIVKDSTNKYGALELNQDGITEIMNISFDYIGKINKDSKFLVNTNKKYFIYNKNGKLESKGFTSQVKNYNDKYVVIDNNGEYLYDYQAKIVINESFDYIDLMNDYVGLVKDNKLYIRDYKNNKYNEEGIELFNDNYSLVNTYDKDNKLIKTDYSYKIDINDSNFEITYMNRNNKERQASVSISDGKISTNYDNLNYFDGKLYIYKEENKETLLGIYTCTNKNNTIDNKELNNCMIAKENTGFIPIINERFVFILDSLDLNNKTIMLYDLSSNKILSRYTNVNTGLNPQDAKVTFVNNNDLYIMAVNRNNKHGVIKVEDEVKGIIPFNYTNIEKLNDNYVAVDNNYTLFDNNGKKLATSSSKIVDYNSEYLIVVQDDLYYVANLNGEKISKGNLHVKLESDYYVVINTDKKLDIKKYDDPNFGLASPISIETDDYANSYKVRKSSEGYTIIITNTNKTIVVDDKGVEKNPTNE